MRAAVIAGVCCNFLFAVALFAVQLPAAAESGPEPGIAAAFSACGMGPASLEGRIEALSAAGWVIAGATPESRDLFALGAVADVTLYQDRSEADHLTLFEAQRNLAPRPQFFPKNDDNNPTEQLSVGSVPNGKKIVSLIERYESYTVIDLVLPSASAGISLTLERRPVLAVSYDLWCKLLLSAPVPASALDSLIPAKIASASVTTDVDPDTPWRRSVTFKDGAGNEAHLVHIDMTAFPNFIAFPSRAGSSAALSTILHLKASPILPTDHRSRPAKVTP